MGLCYPVNTIADLASLSMAVSGDFALVGLNRRRLYVYLGSPLAWSELEKVLITPGDLVMGESGITELTGDATAGPGSGSQAVTLADTAVTPGSYTNADLTINSKGLVTAAANGTAGSGMVRLAETILGADTATVTFSAISSSYRHLRLDLVVRNDNAGTGATDGYLQFNGDTAANYSRSYFAWDGSTTSSGSNIGVAKAPAFFAVNNGAAAGLATVSSMELFDYARTQWIKTGASLMAWPRALSSGNLGGNGVSFVWNSTAAINAILIGMTDSSKFKTGSVFTLYGLP